MITPNRTQIFCCYDLPVAGMLGALLCVAGLLGGLPAPARAAGGKVVARVNGETIAAADLLANLPTDQFATSQADLKTTKLNRLIDAAVLRQFLRKEKVHVDEHLIDKDIADLKRNPPSAGCMCCRYVNLDQYLKVNAYAMSEFRAEIRNNEGMDQYLNQQWAAKHPTRPARLALAAHERARVTASYVKCWQIFFNTFQQAAISSDPERVGQEKKALAEQAWQRLKKGETFGAVAKAMSEDQMTRANGGSLGCQRRDALGEEVKDTFAHLPAGAYSKPVQSVWGYHIIKWAPMTDADILSVLKQEFKEKQWDLEFAQVKKHAKIIRL